jgi:hypothetical protein
MVITPIIPATQERETEGSQARLVRSYLKNKQIGGIYSSSGRALTVPKRKKNISPFCIASQQFCLHFTISEFNSLH